MMFFGQNLRAWREHLGLSSTDLAQKARLARPNLVAIEQGRKDINLSTLLRLAQALEMKPGQLLDQSPPAIPMDRFKIQRMAQAVLGQRSLKNPLEKALAYETGRHLTQFLTSVGFSPKKILKALKPHPGRVRKFSQHELEPLLKRVQHLTPKFEKKPHV